MAKGPITKSALIQILVDKSANELTRKDVKGILGPWSRSAMPS